MKGFAYWAVLFLFLLVSCSGKVEEVYEVVEPDAVEHSDEIQFDADRFWASVDFDFERYALIIDNFGIGYDYMDRQVENLHRLAGFDVFRYASPGAEDMKKAIDEFLVLVESEPDASFFIFYSGDCVLTEDSCYLVSDDIDKKNPTQVVGQGYNIGGLADVFDNKEVFFALDIPDYSSSFIQDNLKNHPCIFSSEGVDSDLFRLILFDELSCGYLPVLDTFTEVSERISIITEDSWKCRISGEYSPFIFVNGDILGRMIGLLEGVKGAMSISDVDGLGYIDNWIGMLESKADEAYSASTAVSEELIAVERIARNNRMTAEIAADVSQCAISGIGELAADMERFDDLYASFSDEADDLFLPYRDSFVEERDKLLGMPYSKDEQTIRKEPKTLEIRYRHDEVASLIDRYQEDFAIEIDAAYAVFAHQTEGMLIDAALKMMMLESSQFSLSTQCGRYYLDIGSYDDTEDGWLLKIRGFDRSGIGMDIFLPYSKLEALIGRYGLEKDEAIIGFDKLFSRDADVLRVDMVYRIDFIASNEFKIIPVDLKVVDNVFGTVLLAYSELELDGVLFNSTIELPPFGFMSSPEASLFLPNVSVPQKLVRGPAGGWIIYDCDADNSHGNYDGLVSSECGWRYMEVASSYLLVGKDGLTYLDPDGNDVVHGCKFDEGIDGYILFPSTGTGIGAGFSNTRMLASMGVDAALLCSSLEAGGYSDWFLPSKDEMKLASAVLEVDGDVWTSSILDHEVVWKSGGSGLWSGEGKILPMRVFR